MIGQVFSQNSINNYKYVVVPMQFDFVKGKDRYRLNTLTRHLFKQEGFDVYFDEQELPEDLFKNRCLAMYADVKKVKSFLTVKTQIELKDCYGKIITVSEVGKTKEKEYSKAYNITIRKAFESIKFLNYEYQPKTDDVITKETTVTSSNEQTDKAEIERLKKEVEALKNKEIETKEVSEKIDTQKEIEKPKEKIETLKEAAPVKIPEMKRDKTLKTELVEGGYRVLDVDGAVVMTLLKTAAPNVYTVKGKDAIVFKKDRQWIYSENTGDSKIEKVLDIKL